MSEQELFNVYTTVGVGVIAQSLLAWELGSKGLQRLLLEGPGLRVLLAFALFVISGIWERSRSLVSPFVHWTDGWPLVIAVLVFLVARTKRLEPGTKSSASQRRRASSDPRLAAFLGGKDLYYAYLKRVNLPLEKWTRRDREKAATDASLADAATLYQRARDLSLEDWPRDAGIADYHLGMLFHIQGEYASARKAFDDALSLLGDYASDEEAIGSSAGCHYHLGHIDEVERSLARARAHFKQAYDLEMSIGKKRDANDSKTALERCGGSIVD